MSDFSTYALLDPDFYASFEQREPGAEYLPVVAGLAERGWTIAPGGVWTHVHPQGCAISRQGWKLHLSATPVNAAVVLARVIDVLQADPAPFKFASDRTMVTVLTSKNWPREGGGKFITLYPAGDEQFHRLAHALSEATARLDGPYILSDRRVPGPSRIVFYRYGEHQPAHELDAWGQRVAQVVGPGGEKAPDQRQGYYRYPEWVVDPYGAQPVPVLEGVRRVTLRDRYEIRAALKFSNLGGVYRGIDLERDAPVVLRERRPFTGWASTTTDGVALLWKEARILRRMEGTHWVPALVDEFQVWEHHYLAMEEVRGLPLREYALSRYFGPKRVASPRWLFATFRRLILELLDAVAEFHRRGIILRDLTAGNVLVRPDRSICVIDFEFAWERDGSEPYAPGIHTPGSASPEQMAGNPPTEADDYYALGAILVELCSMMAPGLGLNPDGVFTAAGMMMDEVELPHELLQVARGLIHPDPARRWTAEQVRRTLVAVPAGRVSLRAREPGQTVADAVGPACGNTATVCEELCRFFEASARPDGETHVWPTTPEAYQINAVCIQFGACGPIEFVRRVRGRCPEAWLDWAERAATSNRCPPGLYVGLAGVALTLAGCGRREAALRLIRTAASNPLLEAVPGLYQGAAGVGVAALALAAALDEPELSALAVRLGDALEERAVRRPGGLAWPMRGITPCGLGSGAGGVALFLTYLGAATGREHYWTVAREALEFEFSRVSRRAGYAFWPSTAGRLRRFRSPHVYFGSAGVCTAAVRLYACTGDRELLEWSETAAETLTFRWTNKLWQDFGYAGWGETLLDMYAATTNLRWLHAARRTAEVILPMRVQTRFGTAFPGGALNRVACDFGMGASGVGLFLHRLSSRGAHRTFYPDHLLPRWPAEPTPRVPAALVFSGVRVEEPIPA